MFPQKDPLPGSQCEVPIDNWNPERGAGQRRLDMRGHVIGTFRGVSVERVVLGYQSFEPVLEVRSGGWVRVLLDRQAGRGVPNEDGTETLTDIARADEISDLVGDLVESSACDTNLKLLDHGASITHGYIDNLLCRCWRVGGLRIGSGQVLRTLDGAVEMNAEP